MAVVIKGIEPSVDPAETKEDLEQQGFSLKIVFNIINREKVPQPMFKAELMPEVKNLKKERHILFIKYAPYFIGGLLRRSLSKGKW